MAVILADADLFGVDGESEEDYEEEWDAPPPASTPPAPPPSLLQLQRSESAERGRELLQRGLSGAEAEGGGGESKHASGNLKAESSAAPRKTMPGTVTIPFNGVELNATRMAPAPGTGGEGIIHWIGTNEGTEPWSNPAEVGQMVVTRSSDYKWGGKASDAVGDRGRRCCTEDLRGQFYCFDLMEYEACPNRYGLRHGHDQPRDSLRHWRLDASNDGVKWRCLREHSDEMALHGAYASASWNLHPQAGFFRFFRVVQTGPCSNGCDNMFLSGFELWGT
eukprot:g5190.t1